MSDDLPRRGTPSVDYDRLYRAIGSRKCAPAEMVQWVFDHAGVSPGMIPDDDWPCFGAVRLLAQASVDYQSFIQLWAKLLPNQTQLKLQERVKDDGRQTVMLDQLEAELFGKENNDVA